MDHTELAVRFTYHAPKGDQAERYQKLRQLCYELGTHVLELTPDSREQSLAMTRLEEVVFWANAAIARRDDGQTPMIEDDPVSASGRTVAETSDEGEHSHV